MQDLELNLVRAFVAVAETGSFTAAAQVINRTQSAVSQKVLKLEDVLQMRLFERNSRSLSLTRDGERALAAGKRLLEQYDMFLRELRDPPRIATLKLGVSENLIQTQLPKVLARLKEHYPDIQLELTMGSSHVLLEAHAAGLLDVVIARTCGKLASTRSRVIWREPLVWAAGADYQDDPGRPASLVMMPSPCVYREVMIDTLESARREWRLGCMVSNLNGIHAAVLGGLGVTVLGKSMIREGMRILPASRHWPALPTAEVSIVGENPELQPITQPLATFLADALAQARSAQADLALEARKSAPAESGHRARNFPQAIGDSTPAVIGRRGSGRRRRGGGFGAGLG